jgi:hypothetical protein
LVFAAGLALTLAACGAPEGPAGTTSQPASTQPPTDPATLYASAKPYVRWWWFSSWIEEDDVRSQLDWLADNGFGGVEIAWIYPLDREPENVLRRQAWLGEEWSRIVASTKEYAASLGLGCDFTFGTMWPFGDTQVPPEDGARVHGGIPMERTPLRLSWEYPSVGRVIDHLNRGALQRYGERVGAALAPALEAGPGCLFCDSWEVETRRIWTDGLGEEFEQRYGYDVRPLMEEIYAPENAGAHYDYMKLVSERVLDEFFRPFTRLAHRLGALSRVQCCGAPTDIITAYASVDVPETEAMLYEPGYALIPASAAALSGKKVVSSETFTCLYGFPDVGLGEERTTDLKLVADALFAHGVNQIVWHGKPFNPEGEDDQRFYATVHVGPSGALAGDLAGFNEYMQKVSRVMRRGHSCSDVAAYLPLEDAWRAQEYPENKQMPWSWGAYELRYERPPEALRGRHPLWINRHFLEQGVVRDGRLEVGDARFSAVHVEAEFLDEAVVKRLVELASEGLPVVVARRPKPPGHRPDEDYPLRVDRLMAHANVHGSLAELELGPPLVSGEDLPDFWCREDGDARYLFFAHPRAQGLTLPLTPGQAATEETITREVSIAAGNAATEVTLRFEPHQSLLLRVTADGAAEPVDITFDPR